MYLDYNTVVALCYFFGFEFLLGFFFFIETIRQPMYVSHIIRTFYYCLSLSYIVWIYSLTVMIISQKYQELFVQEEVSE
jgi:hypothetical protein